MEVEKNPDFILNPKTFNGLLSNSKAIIRFASNMPVLNLKSIRMYGREKETRKLKCFYQSQ